MTTSTPVSVQAQVIALNAGWYNVVTKAMGITDPNFQLAQGTLGLQTADSSGLFLMADACPENSAVAYYDPAGLAKRSSGFQLLLSALLPEGGTTLTTVLGDMYAAWISFKSDFYTANPTTTLSPLNCLEGEDSGIQCLETPGTGHLGESRTFRTNCAQQCGLSDLDFQAPSLLISATHSHR